MQVEAAWGFNGCSPVCCEVLDPSSSPCRAAQVHTVVCQGCLGVGPAAWELRVCGCCSKKPMCQEGILQDLVLFKAIFVSFKGPLGYFFVIFGRGGFLIKQVLSVRRLSKNKTLDDVPRRILEVLREGPRT